MGVDTEDFDGGDGMIALLVTIISDDDAGEPLGQCVVGGPCGDIQHNFESPWGRCRAAMLVSGRTQVHAQFLRSLPPPPLACEDSTAPITATFDCFCSALLV